MLHRKADWVLFPLPPAPELFAPLPTTRPAPPRPRSGDGNFYDGERWRDRNYGSERRPLLAAAPRDDEYITVLIKNLPYLYYRLTYRPRETSLRSPWNIIYIHPGIPGIRDAIVGWSRNGVVTPMLVTAYSNSRLLNPMGIEMEKFLFQSFCGWKNNLVFISYFLWDRMIRLFVWLFFEFLSRYIDLGCNGIC